MKNKFCDNGQLTNEASVEATFLIPLIWDLGYEHKDVSFKESISEIPIGKGSKKILYKPDFVLKADGIPYVVIDAKSPAENINEWTLQCSSYCLEINKLYDYNPVQYYAITNGEKFQLYRWDKKDCIMELCFSDFKDAEEKYEELKHLISKQNVLQDAKEMLRKIESEDFEFGIVDLTELSNVFSSLHNMIWRIEKKSPSAAFSELIKIIFIKIDRDKRIHNQYGKNPKPKYRDVVFSTHWIMSQTENENPLNDPLFKNLLADLEREISEKHKKRIFDVGEKINLSPETVIKVVKSLEHIDVYAMEEDVNGRLFESFLDATARGRDIGQFFTPREIVDLMVELADIQISKDYIPKILDACCGSGGFLISSMDRMMKELDSLVGITNFERTEISKKIKEESVFGIDAGSEPAMYRIARMNMYLHGDGGSKIFCADSLDKNLGKIGPASIENDAQLEEIRDYLVNKKIKFDVILSNPPFSLQYSREDAEQAEILNQYDMAVDRVGGKIYNKLLSSVMFIERYKDLVSENGQILAIIDDSVLSGDSYKYIRDYIREKFIIKAIISLPGDAFKRSMARVKTSIIVLRLKKEEEEQTEVFMYSIKYLGLEAKIAKRIGIDVTRLSKLKMNEKDELLKVYKDFRIGKATKYAISSHCIQNRLDVKYCINDRGRLQKRWVEEGYKVTKVGAELELQQDREIEVLEDEKYQLLKVTYEGDVCEGEIKDGEECSYSKLYSVKAWDILVSNMGVGRGAVGIVPPYHSGKYVSNEYTILNANSNEEAVFYVNLLRTKEILANILSSTTGMNRGRIKWNVIKDISVPKCEKNDSKLKKLSKEIVSYWKATEKYMRNKQKHSHDLVELFGVDGDASKERWLGFKPPE